MGSFTASDAGRANRVDGGGRAGRICMCVLIQRGA